MSVEIFNDDGTVVDYRLVSERLPDFLKEYPPDKFRVVIEAVDELEARPGLGRLLAEALRSDKSISDLALLNGIETHCMIFRATLINSANQVVATASARKSIVFPKDWEAGETAARQRLLAALGFGGETLDQDEQHDMSGQGQQAGNPSGDSTEEVAPGAVDGVTKKENGENKGEGTAVPEYLVRQIEHHAKIKGKGKKILPYTNEKEAKQVLRELIAA